LGFARLGVAPVNAQTLAEEAAAKAVTQRWVASKLHGALDYMKTPRSSPGELLPGAKSVIVALAPTESVSQPHVEGSKGRIAAYAQGADYHVALKAKLWQVAQQLCDDVQQPLRARVCVDTAPVLERFWAAASGVTFTGKSTMAIAPGVGSNVMLGLLIVDVELPFGLRLPGGCGECTLCIDACPTQAFTAPFVLDAARCIATLTIENVGDIAEELRPALANRVFGCDECQTVCPYNSSRKRPSPMLDLAANAERSGADLRRWAALTSGDYKRLTKQSALRRAPRAQLQRNAVVALGNIHEPTPEDVEVLASVLRSNPSPLVRKHAAWALARVAPAQARALFPTLSDTEPDDVVRSELARLLETLPVNEE
jgi:epoxyqueuosine reductase